MNENYCASCLNRGRDWKTEDTDGIQHCSKYGLGEERFCIHNNHKLWEQDKPSTEKIEN